jgi:hypothetical protein
MNDNVVSRFFGGPPLAVAVKLILLSIVVGVILAALDLDPLNIVRSIQRLAHMIWDMGFDAVLWVWRYFVLGAVLVIPIWLIVRLVRRASGKA